MSTAHTTSYEDILRQYAELESKKRIALERDDFATFETCRVAQEKMRKEHPELTRGDC